MLSLQLELHLGLLPNRECRARHFSVYSERRQAWDLYERPPRRRFVEFLQLWLRFPAAIRSH